MSFDSLLAEAWPWRGALLALLLAFAWAAGLRVARQPALAPAAAALGVALGWGATMGIVTASPRQLVERLPMLAMALVPLVLPVAGLARGRAAMLGVVAAWLGVLGAAWWMAGGPVHGPSLVVALPVFAGVAAYGAALLWRMGDALEGGKAALALFAGLVAAGGFGPQPVLAACLVGAAFGAVLAGAGGGPAPRVA
ncbi:MAG: hypothetical protein V4653_18795, partial [Pseudomonadota bacterium]